MVICMKRMGNRGEIVIPKKMREEKGFEIDGEVSIVPTKRGVLLIPASGKKAEDFVGIFGKHKIGDLDKLNREVDAFMYNL